MSELAAALCSITPTQRRRFFWAVWASGAPRRHPFRKPDASHGGARTREEALAEAERVTGRAVVEIEPHWARAWSRVLRGQPPFNEREVAAQDRPRPPPKQRSGDGERASARALLGLSPGATLEEIKRAYKKRALETHPDRGGDPDVFRRVQRAFERLSERAAKAERRPARR